MRATTIELDLSRASWLDPKVVVPEDCEYHGPLRCEIVETGRTLIAHRARLLHPGDRALTVRVQATWLMPDPERGTVRTDRGGRIELHAVRAPLVHLRWPHPAHSLSVELWQNGEPDRRDRHAYRRGSGFAFNAPPKGRYDMVLRTRGWAPLVLRNVLLGGEMTLDRKLRPIRGCTLMVHPRQLPAGIVPSVQVRLKDPPVWLGSDGVGAMYSGGLVGWSLRAIPAGEIEVEVVGGEHSWSKRVSSDGVTHQTVEIDCSD